MSRINDVNRSIAEKITAGVSTMWAAYIFAAIALISLPAAIRSGDTLTIVDWLAQTLLQLVLLSVIMVGQQKSSEKVSQQIRETHEASIAEFELARQSREIATQELAEIKRMSAEIHQILKDIEKK